MLSFVALTAISFATDFQLYEDAQWRQRALENYQEDFQEIQQKQRDEDFVATLLAEEAVLRAQIADLEDFQQKRIADDKAEAEKFARREENLQRYQRDSYLAASHEAEFPANEKNFGTASRARKFKAKAKKDESAFRNAQAEKRSRKYAQQAIEAKHIEESEAETQPSAGILKKKEKEQAHKAKWAQRAENARMKREVETLKREKLEKEKQDALENASSNSSTAENGPSNSSTAENASSNSSPAEPQSIPDSDSDQPEVVKSAPARRSVLRGFGNFASWICSGQTCRAYWH